jgi:hypothetical protein
MKIRKDPLQCGMLSFVLVEKGTDLTLDKCPWTRTFEAGPNSCMASSIMLHVKPKASIYMENVWLWVAGIVTKSSDAGARKLIS